MAYHDVYLRPDGSFECVYSDVVDVSELGRVEIERASHVEFDNGLQCWVVEWTERMDILRKEGKAYFEKRDEALAWEVEQINAVMAEGYGLVG